ncbi:MAG: hypothetical protein DIU71_06010 [Proteobacteria bacterium]|nr:MAG: hypothetical protein DIU71_06010 [Pseudomonadota bacterium]
MKINTSSDLSNLLQDRFASHCAGPGRSGVTHPGRGRLSALVLAALLATACSSAPEPAAPAEEQKILIGDSDVYPESITSTSDGALITGSLKGIVFRAPAGEKVAWPWIRPNEENGLMAVFGVLAHEPSSTLWVCNVPNPFDPPAEPRPTALVAFDLESGAWRATYPFPEPTGVCNDIAVAENGVVYATDTPNGRILTLAPGETELRVFGADERLKGIDGVAFDAAGTMYVNIVSRGALVRVDIAPDGTMGELTELELSEPISGPDGLRPIEGNRFLQAEGTGGRVTEVIIEGDRANIRVLKDGLNSVPGVTLVGRTAYAIEGKIGYLVDPELKGQDPGPFEILAIPLH